MKKILSLFLFFLIGLSFLSTPKTAAAACTPHPPEIDVAPQSRNRNGAPGDEKQYIVKITNKDAGTTCPNVQFKLTKEQLPGTNWKGHFEDNTLVIAKQRSKSTTFKLRSPITSSAGRKPINLGVKPESRPTRPKRIFNIYYTVQLPPSPTPTPTPILCGGFAGLRCPDGYTCQYPDVSPYPDESGICVPNTTPSPSPTPTPANCRRTPEVTVTADKTFVKPGGGTITYTVKVENVDIRPCPERNMNLTRKLHNDNWEGPWDPNNNINNFTIGQTRTKKLVVTSPNQAPADTYIVKIDLRNNSDEVVVTKKVNFVIANRAPSPTPTRRPTPTPTGRPTPTPTRGPSPTPRPSGAPTPSPTPRPTPGPEEITIDFVIGLDGIGTTSRVPLGGNKNPEEKDRVLNFYLYKTTDNSLAFSWQESVTYDDDLEKFTAVMTLPKPDKAAIPNGTYNFYVSGEPFLTRQYPGSITLTAGQTTVIKLDTFNLVTGNITNSGQSDNKIDPLDYNVLVACSIYSRNEDQCDQNSNYRNSSDLDDSGIINEDDLTLWLKEASIQEGDKPPGEPTPTPSPTPTITPSPTPRPTGSPSPTPTPANCRRTPEVTVTADKTFVKPGGGTITYTVKVENVDIRPCPERNMNLTRKLHNDNWEGPWDPNNNINNFTIGQTRTKKLVVTSPNQAPADTYIVKIDLRNNSDEVVVTKKVNFVIRSN